jgi:hypothetical protein
MKITRAKSRKPDGGGWILYGNRPDNGKWLERWFPTKEKAVNFCNRKDWHWRDSVD